ncbi:MAG TPA: hypothetical protein VM580_16240 [Labilithrix sp.]|jgi:hypothetical protein|nr:hypothetical protein [Labilithrix sp.]
MGVPSSAEGSPAPTATEIVTRPEPGLARGKWEAPAWAFWVILALVVLGAAAYFVRRLGVLRFGEGKNGEPTPPSSRVRRP